MEENGGEGEKGWSGGDGMDGAERLYTMTGKWTKLEQGKCSKWQTYVIEKLKHEMLIMCSHDKNKYKMIHSLKPSNNVIRYLYIMTTTCCAW